MDHEIICDIPKGRLDGNLEEEEITNALYDTLISAQKDFDRLKPFLIKKGQRWDAQAQYIKVVFAASLPNEKYHEGECRLEKYQILIGAGVYGNNEYLNKVNEIQKVTTLLRQVFHHYEEMIIKDNEGNEIIDLRENLDILECFPTYLDSGDVIKEGIMNLQFSVDENLYKTVDEFEKIVHDTPEIEFEDNNNLADSEDSE